MELREEGEEKMIETQGVEDDCVGTQRDSHEEAAKAGRELKEEQHGNFEDVHVDIRKMEEEEEENRRENGVVEEGKQVAPRVDLNVHEEGESPFAVFAEKRRNLPAVVTKREHHQDSSDDDGKGSRREDGSQMLSDEEMAWRLHKELNSSTPVLRTRSQRGTRGKSLLSEGSVHDSQVLEMGNSDEVHQQVGRREHKRGRKKAEVDGEGEKRGRKRGEREKDEQDNAKSSKVRKSPRNVDAGEAYFETEDKVDKQDIRSDASIGSNGKLRSRKGKPKPASLGGSSASLDQTAVTQEGEGKKKRALKRLPKIPKLPMVRQGKNWYRARVLEESKDKIYVEFAGFEQQISPLWLDKYCDRVWLGSYKGKDWRYQGEGAWVPKNGIQNRLIHPEEYKMGDIGSDNGDGHAVSGAGEDLAGRNEKNIIVFTPNLMADSIVKEEVQTSMRGRKSRLKDKKKSSDEESAPSRGRRGRGKRKSSSDEDGGDAQTDGDDTDEGKNVRTNRPRRASKKTAIFNSSEFAVDTEVDLLEPEHHGWKYMSSQMEEERAVKGDHGMQPSSLGTGGTSHEYRYHRRKPPVLLRQEDEPDFGPESLDEKEALEALAEMPSSPGRNMQNDIAFEESREALLDAYGSIKTEMGKQKRHSSENGTSKKSGRQWKSAGKAKLKHSCSAESLLVAEKMFGDLLGAIATKMGSPNVGALQRSSSAPSSWNQGKGSAGGMGWSPHIWSSGVTPANGEPAIVNVPTSLIQDALSQRYARRSLEKDSFVKPPVPLFC